MSGVFRIGLGVLLSVMVASSVVKADGWGDTSKAPATFDNDISSDGLRLGGIANTRHNLTISYNTANVETMADYRNNYYEICVYCHTPHGANSTVAAPLWNRTVSSSVYTVFPRANTMLGQPVTQPGPNSLTCLSCHDGVTAIDSIINMPTRLEGAFRAGYSSGQETSSNPTFLSAWATEGNELLAEEGRFTTLNQLGPGSGEQHFSLGSGASGQGCITCHRRGGTQTAPDFTPFIIGADGIPAVTGTDVSDPDNTGIRGLSAGTGNLNDDHPIGVRYPTDFGSGVDYNPPTVQQSKIAFFDRDGDRHADANEIRLYNTGDGYEVECASCHDPHGVPMKYDQNGAPSDSTATSENNLIPSFLRVGSLVGTSNPVGNPGSDLCLTCHVK